MSENQTENERVIRQFNSEVRGRLQVSLSVGDVTESGLLLVESEKNKCICVACVCDSVWINPWLKLCVFTRLLTLICFDKGTAITKPSKYKQCVQWE